ncbi:hypothetical protein GOP56_12315 [Brevibacillus sp. 7WMA2]|uniref:YcdB/YcdC domain-containing protein n=1 Tax=Brevibacillus sp. 7WMA2 TaxID=2683193 RepID=UPI0013A76002|nr:YcdB/YcdC domain-containing protein [Brevibacillus sp. 7WMA2]QIC06316.1 hypothetical protein GOP56_12315 [Brevibacillus sp. 7WMA2]
MKKSTNKTVLSLMAALMLSSTPVWASAKTISEEPEKIQTIQELDQVVKKSIEQLTEVLPELKEFTEMEISQFSEGSTRIILSKEKGVLYPSVKIVLNSAGVIEEFDIDREEIYSKEPVDKEMATEKGKAFLKKLLGDRANQYKVSGNIKPAGGENDGTYSWINITFNRMIGGITLNDDYYYLRINPNGDIIGMVKKSPTSSDEDLPKPEKIISKEQAEEALAKVIHPFIKANDGKVIYRFLETPYVNAETGERIISFHDRIFSDPYPTKQNGEKLVAKTSDEAAKVLKSVLDFDVTGLTLDEQMDNGQKLYMWYKNKERMAVVATKENQVIDVVIDNKRMPEGAKAKISIEEGQTLAVNTLQKYLGDDVKELINESSALLSENNVVVDYKISPVHAGIEIFDRSYTVTVNRITGKVTAIRGIGETSKKLPDKDSIIDAKTAVKAILKDTPLKLVYVTASTTGKDGDAYLAYTVDNDIAIDGITGKPVKE